MDTDRDSTVRVPSNADLATNLRMWASFIKLNTVDNAEMALDLIMAAQRLESPPEETGSC